MADPDDNREHPPGDGCAHQTGSPQHVTGQYTFAAWLATQTHRTDWVGGTARDITADIRDHGLQLETAGDVQRHVKRSGGPARSYDALEAAFQEWVILPCAREPETLETTDGSFTFNWLPDVAKVTP